MAKSRYKVTKIDARTWMIEEKTIIGKGIMYLLEGDTSALLIDTGLGLGNLKALTASLTNKKVSVVSTHGHFDHVSGNYQFEDIYLHKNDQEVFTRFMSSEFLNGLSKRTFPWVARFLLSGTLRKAFSPQIGGTYHFIDDGHVFDLGGRQIEVILTPGHTPGSICLFDRESRRLFTGDTVGNQNCLLNMELSCSPDVYLKSLRRLKECYEEFDTIFPGHDKAPKTKACFDEYLACAEGIEDGSIVLQQAKFGKAPCLKATYGTIFIALPLKERKQ